MSPELELQMLSVQTLVKGGVAVLNDALKHKDCSRLRTVWPMADYSEASIGVVEAAMTVLAVGPASTEGSILTNAYLDRFGPVKDIATTIIRDLSFYTTEVARRNLGLQWHSEKKLFSAMKFGLRNPKTGEFFSLEYMRGSTPLERYCELKARISGISREQVQLSTQPRPLNRQPGNYPADHAIPG